MAPKKIDIPNNIGDLAKGTEAEAQAAAARETADHHNAPHMLTTEQLHALIAAAQEQQATAPPPERQRQLNFSRVPESLFQAIREHSRMRGYGGSLRILLFHLLKDDGMDIPEEYLHDQRMR
ncbi:hypothetical protein [Magnetospira sp. QH-2]|uniref:hypothetical protein n=1 Tax=Magnetospira sp. (strain QH-2) TaxID=1288970 RepID=UPI0003E8105C|nr:hypothetical protein [Magnetospira sp. QH-2]CCQ75775.1 Protein of unknown function [Magnetospira sp. QH-2]